MVRLAFAILTCMLLAGCDRRPAIGPEANAAEALDLRKKLAAGGSSETAAAGGATETAATGWATIKGTFKVAGAPPTPGKINADKDTAVCGKHPLFDESVTVGKDGGLQNVVIFCRTKKPPVHPDYAESASANVVLDNKDCRFEPHVVVMRSGQTLQVKNSDPVGHNTKYDGVQSPPFNVLIPANSDSLQKISVEEGLPVKVGCSIHPWMGGWVVVRSDPYAAVTSDTGAFELKNVPAGKELEFQLWQEKKGPLTSVKVDGVKVDTKGRFKVKLDPDKELTLAFEVPADALK